MKNTIKALSKQIFGAKYESARKSLLAAAILFIAIYAAEIRVAVAPAILYLTSTLFTAGVMWQVLTGRRQMEPNWKNGSLNWTAGMPRVTQPCC